MSAAEIDTGRPTVFSKKGRTIEPDPNSTDPMDEPSMDWNPEAEGSKTPK